MSNEPKYDNCLDCIHAKFQRGIQRGVMDCDPDEYWCSMDDPYFNGEREYDEDGEELYCPYYRERGWDD